jgi:hypothetical protein
MKFLVLAVMASSFSSAAFAQRHPVQLTAPGGYGNILFPAPGHAPRTPPTGVTGSYSSQSLWPPRRATGLQPSGVFVPWLMYDSGYTADRSGNDQQGDPGQTLVTESSPPPPVIINKSLVSPEGPVQPHVINPRDGAPLCGNGQCNVNRPQVADESRPTIYLLAFKDHRIVQALGYWMEAGTLHYVSVEYGLNQASISLIDRDLSQHLNDERGIAFNLPMAK